MLTTIRQQQQDTGIVSSINRVPECPEFASEIMLQLKIPPGDMGVSEE